MVPPMRGQVRAVAVVLATACALLAVSAPERAGADTTLEHWTGNLCQSVAEWLTNTEKGPVPDPGGDERLAVRRFVSDIVQNANGWIRVAVRYPPPVSGGRKLRARIERALDDAIAEFEAADKLLARPNPTPSVLRSADRRLRAGYDKIVTTMQQLRGHSGSRGFDEAMRANQFCNFVPQLRTTGSGSAA
jgi:hypothetical protein